MTQQTILMLKACMVSHCTGIEVGSWSVISLEPMQAFPSIFCPEQKAWVQGYSIILPISQDISHV